MWQLTGILSLFFALQAFISPCLADDDLEKKIKHIIDDPAYKLSRWGILIADDKGRPIFERDADRLFIPASTTKLFSCAAALIELGPDYRFNTPVYARGTVIDGVLEGDLILVASGDLSFGGRNTKTGGLAFVNDDHTYANASFGPTGLTPTNPLFALESLSKQIAKRGIKEIKGEILIDDRLFMVSHGSGSGPNLLSAIVINDNVIDIVISPGKNAGDRAEVRMHPETSFIHMDADVETVAEKKENAIMVQPAGITQFTVRGQIALDSKPLVRIFHIDQMALFARALFIESLRRQGIRVHASIHKIDLFVPPAQHGHNGMMRVASFESEPLSETIKVTMKVSHNLYASTLPLLIAAKHDERTLDQGMIRQGKILQKLGLPIESLCFASGAGGASADMVTPRATVQLLKVMSERNEATSYFNALPVLGVDGTLAEVVGPESKARGKVRAKSGTLAWFDSMNQRMILRSKALAGVMETTKKSKLFFAFFLNDLPLKNEKQASSIAKTLGKLCEIVCQYGP